MSGNTTMRYREQDLGELVLVSNCIITLIYVIFVYRIPNLGSGSDYTPFLQNLGITSANIHYVHSVSNVALISN